MSALWRERHPSKLALAPERFSYSSLSALETCPRRVQLLRSTWSWGHRYPDRGSPAVVLGRVVHRALEELIARLQAAGGPGFGSPGFVSVSKSFLADGRIQALIQEETGAYVNNPRHRGLDLPSVAPMDCRNSLTRLLKQVWRTTSAQSPCDMAMPRHGDTLSEVPLQHPSLPLEGRVDLVDVDDTLGDRIVDVKTGDAREEHEDQIRLYGLLWWRTKGRLACRGRVVSATGSVVDLAWAQADLEALELRIGEDIRRWQALPADRPWTALPNADACRTCPVRQLCDDYWEAQVTTQLRSHAEGGPESGFMDLELFVDRIGGPSSVHGTTANGTELALVAERGMSVAVAPPVSGNRIRALGVVRRRTGEVSVVRSSEVFVFDS